MTPSDFTLWNRRVKPSPGDIILTREAPMGHACILPKGHEVCLTQRLLLLRANPDTVLSDFVLHYLNSPLFREQVLSGCRGLTTPHIRVQDAPQFVLPLPPLVEQQRIVNRLANIKACVAKLQQYQSALQDELNALLPSVLDRAFKGQL
jgi:type I restriction enzyme S subunit